MADPYVCCLRGKARADGEPASVTDEKPARDSAGRCGPVDYGLPFPPPPWFGLTSEIVLTGALGRLPSRETWCVLRTI